MKTLQWIGVPLLVASLFVACNMDNDANKEEPIVETDDVEVKERDRIFGEWDMDRNDGISRNEFGDRWQDADYDRWDTDRDGILNDKEYGEGIFDRMDRDKSGRLTDNERDPAWQQQKDGKNIDWDRDGNKEMDREEFRQIFTMNTDFKDWDENGDGRLDKSEYTNRMYRRMDANADGVISKGEFNTEEQN